MKLTFLAFSLWACSFPVLAQGPSQSEENFCSDRQDNNFVKNLTMDSNNLMTFVNDGGLANGGVCWWHSRFQRNALYLTIYKPDLAKPSQNEARELVKKIRTAKEVVVIPGFKNFASFAKANEKLIQREIEKWQLVESSIGFAWIKGLAGEPKVPADKMKELMDQTYQEVEVNQNIAYNKLQIPGITAHAWLVIHMDRTDWGYTLEVLDSNAPSYLQRYEYHEGDQFLVYTNSDVSADTLQDLMDEAYEMKEIQKKYSEAVILPGLKSHPWAVDRLMKVEGGYNLKARIYLSNKKVEQYVTYEYRIGDTKINYSAFEEERQVYPVFTPYLEEINEMKKIREVISKKCNPVEPSSAPEVRTAVTSTY